MMERAATCCLLVHHTRFHPDGTAQTGEPFAVRYIITDQDRKPARLPLDAAGIALIITEPSKDAS
jgi:DeoR/GlpR family transcriptional regulator of sugar metabolism